MTARGTLRISCENLAHQAYTAWAWSVLPASANLVLTGLTAFAANILGTFLCEPSRVQKHPSVVGITYGMAYWTPLCLPSHWGYSQGAVL